LLGTIAVTTRLPEAPITDPKAVANAKDRPDVDNRPSRLGEILLAGGAITQAQLTHALKQQANLKLPIGQVLLKLNYVSDEVMRQALSLQLNVPYLDLDRVSVDRDLARLINRNYARRHSVLPVALVGRTLTVAMNDPTSQSIVAELSHLTNYAVTVVTSSHKAIERAFKRIYDDTGDAESAVGAEAIVPVDSESVVGSEPVDLEQSQRADELFRLILARALESHSSDVHLEMLPTGFQVRFRVDGVLHPHDFGSRQKALDDAMREIASRVKILSKLDISERRRPQDGSFQVTVDRQGTRTTIDLRVSVIPSHSGESIVIRILDRSRAPKSINEIDVSARVAESIERALARTTGIFLVTGPTGSGKSTTLYACLKRLHKPELRVLTAEDPVEYTHDGMSQCEVNPDIGNTFATYLRSFLRHDPEVIMVGEIRDQETAEMAFRAAQTGHLLLSTLHTNSAIAALPRLLDLKIESSLIASSLIGVISQRLVRKLCEHCKQESVPPRHVLETFFNEPPKDLAFFHGPGCDACNFTGYKGRLMIADVWMPDEGDMLLITRRAPFDEVKKSAARTTFTMAMDAHERLRAGRTTLEELLRVLPYDAIAEHRERFSTGVSEDRV
jgi:type IV pilus assembly protein PilB